jgi:hypothetical protein
MTQRNPSRARTTAGDPLKTIWDALEAGGYRPHGKPYDFHSRCPGHDGDSADSLHISIGADGRALLHCHAHGCDVEQITGALDLTVASMFPAGHRRARRLEVRPARRADFTGAALEAADMIAALDQLGEDWRVELILMCPGCGDGGALFVASSRHRSFMSCEGACTVQMVSQALAGQLQDRPAA